MRPGDTQFHLVTPSIAVSNASIGLVGRPASLSILRSCGRIEFLYCELDILPEGEDYPDYLVTLLFCR